MAFTPCTCLVKHPIDLYGIGNIIMSLSINSNIIMTLMWLGFSAQSMYKPACSINELVCILASLEVSYYCNLICVTYTYMYYDCVAHTVAQAQD